MGKWVSEGLGDWLRLIEINRELKYMNIKTCNMSKNQVSNYPESSIHLSPFGRAVSSIQNNQ